MIRVHSYEPGEHVASRTMTEKEEDRQKNKSSSSASGGASSSASGGASSSDSDGDEVLCYCALGVALGALIVAAALVVHFVSITPNGHSMRFDYRGYHFCVVVPCINLLCFWPLIPVGGLRIYGKKEKGGVSVYHGVGWSCKPFVGVPCSAFTKTWWSCVRTAYLRWPTLGLSIFCNRQTLSADDAAALIDHLGIGADLDVFITSGSEALDGSTPPVAQGPHDAEAALTLPLLGTGTQPIAKDTPIESTFVAVTIAPSGDEEMPTIVVNAFQGTRPVGLATADASEGEAGSPRPAAVPPAPPPSQSLSLQSSPAPPSSGLLSKAELLFHDI
jgi:hypothetical protein